MSGPGLGNNVPGANRSLSHISPDESARMFSIVLFKSWAHAPNEETDIWLCIRLDFNIRLGFFFLPPIGEQVQSNFCVTFREVTDSLIT